MCGGAPFGQSRRTRIFMVKAMSLAMPCAGLHLPWLNGHGGKEQAGDANRPLFV
jgi:hypothetical protein